MIKDLLTTYSKLDNVTIIFYGKKQFQIYHDGEYSWLYPLSSTTKQMIHSLGFKTIKAKKV